MIALGADVNAPDNNGNTPLLWALSNGKLDILRTLINAGADPTLKNNEGKTALEKAATITIGRNACVKYLTSVMKRFKVATPKFIQFLNVKTSPILQFV